MGNSTSTKTKKQLESELKELRDYKFHAFLFGFLFLFASIACIFLYANFEADCQDRLSVVDTELNLCEYNLDMRIEGLRYKSGQVEMCNYAVQFIDYHLNLTPKFLALDNTTLQRFSDEMTHIAELYTEANYEMMEVDSRYYDPVTGENVYVKP